MTEAGEKPLHEKSHFVSVLLSFAALCLFFAFMILNLMTW